MLLDVRKRLRRMRGRAHRCIHIKQLSQPAIWLGSSAWAEVPQVLDPELSGEPQAAAHAVSATTRRQAYPERPPGADLLPKKVGNLDPMVPR